MAYCAQADRLPSRLRGRLDDVAEAFGIALGDHLPGDHLVFEDRQLLDQDRRLQRVEARIDADVDIVVLRFALAVEGEGASLSASASSLVNIAPPSP